MHWRRDVVALGPVQQHSRGIGLTSSRVALNDTIKLFALAPIVALLLGLSSIAALATVVGVSIEVPVIWLVVRVVNLSMDWYERG